MKIIDRRTQALGYPGNGYSHAEATTQLNILYGIIRERRVQTSLPTSDTGETITDGISAGTTTTSIVREPFTGTTTGQFVRMVQDPLIRTRYTSA
ncbi:hypothetical protein BWX42_00265 [Dolosigranulum pigrum]|uniref:Uncharacterized protein n=1 Tax=Dolosigranulum pigrum TaxID=29394 RepID=A0A1S8KKZ3_9LACT|nr:hypothetical protein BWX42_00265 [Dolosigranulum pigrum]